MAKGGGSSSRQGADAAKPSRKRKPVVFMFQPTEFVPVKPRKMKEWEEGLKAAVGPSAPQVLRLLREGGFVETTSICHPGGADDCDVYEGDIGVF